MRVDPDDADVGVLLSDGANGANGAGVITANGEGKLAEVEGSLGGLVGLAAAVGDLEEGREGEEEEGM